MELKLNHIYQGDVLEVLKEMPSKSIDCVITSPPYWALRAYGTNPQVWDGDENCEHSWGEKIDGAGRNNDKTAGEVQRGNKESVGRDDRPGSNFCTKCGAWKGELGLEPTFDLYIKHLCDIFDEVKRVLKDTGSCWVNIGDCYAGNMGKKQGWTDNKLGFGKQEAIDKGMCLTKKTKIEQGDFRKTIKKHD